MKLLLLLLPTATVAFLPRVALTPRVSFARFASSESTPSSSQLREQLLAEIEAYEKSIKAEERLAIEEAVNARVKTQMAQAQAEAALSNLSPLDFVLAGVATIAGARAIATSARLENTTAELEEVKEQLAAQDANIGTTSRRFIVDGIVGAALGAAVGRIFSDPPGKAEQLAAAKKSSEELMEKLQRSEARVKDAEKALETAKAGLLQTKLNAVTPEETALLKEKIIAKENELSDAIKDVVQQTTPLKQQIAAREKELGESASKIAAREKELSESANKLALTERRAAEAEARAAVAQTVAQAKAKEAAAIQSVSSVPATASALAASASPSNSELNLPVIGGLSLAALTTAIGYGVKANEYDELQAQITSAEEAAKKKKPRKVVPAASSVPEKAAKKKKEGT